MKPNLKFAGLTIVLGLSYPHLYAEISFFNLGLLPTHSRFSVGAISGDGTTVVGYGSNEASFSSPNYSVLRWRHDTGLVNLGPLNGSGSGTGYGLNFSGSVMTSGSWESPGYYSYRWTEEGGQQRLPNLEAGVNVIAKGISGDGQTIIGSASTVGIEGSRAFLWNSSVGIRSLGTFGTNFSSEARDINYDGSVVVGSSIETGGEKAFRWTLENGLQDLGRLSTEPYHGAGASAVSTDGANVVGYSWVPGPDNGSLSRAFLWNASSGMQELGLVAGFLSSSATKVNSDASIITGGFWSRSGTYNEETGYSDEGGAFIWTPTDGMVNFEEFLESYGVDLTGWEILGITDMSENGRTLVGNGRLNGEIRGFMVTGVPEPSSLSLLLFGGAVLAAARRRNRD